MVSGLEGFLTLFEMCSERGDGALGLLVLRFECFFLLNGFGLACFFEMEFTVDALGGISLFHQGNQALWRLGSGFKESGQERLVCGLGAV